MKKKSGEAALFGSDGKSDCRAEILQRITGLDDAALRRAAGKGKIPAPQKGRYPIDESLAGIIADLRSRGESLSLPRFDTMEACEGAGYFSKKFLQELKSAGLPGFENTRVDLDKLIPALESWLAGTPDEDHHELNLEGVSSYTGMREKYRAKLSKLEYVKAQDVVIPKEVATSVLRTLQAIHYGAFDRMVEELPTALAGRTAAQIRTRLTELLLPVRTAEEDEIKALEKASEKQLAAAAATPPGK